MPLRGGWGRGRDPTPEGGNWGTIGRAEIKRECGQVSPAHLGPQEPAEIPGLILCPPRPPPATRVLREWEGRGSESKGRTSGTAPLRGGWGRGGVPTPSGTHQRLGVLRRWGRLWGRQLGKGVKEQKGRGPVLSLSTQAPGSLLTFQA